MAVSCFASPHLASRANTGSAREAGGGGWAAAEHAALSGCATVPGSPRQPVCLRCRASGSCRRGPTATLSSRTASTVSQTSRTAVVAVSRNALTFGLSAADCCSRAQVRPPCCRCSGRGQAALSFRHWAACLALLLSLMSLSLSQHGHGCRSRSGGARSVVPSSQCRPGRGRPVSLFALLPCPQSVSTTPMASTPQALRTLPPAFCRLPRC